MTKFHFFIIAALTSMQMIASSPLLAQTFPPSEEYYTNDEPESEGPDRSVSPGVKDTATTESILASLQASTSFCAKIGSSEYTIDCLAERFETLSKQLQGQEGFEEVQAVLEKTAQDLNKIARANRSDTLPPAYISRQGATPVKTNRRVFPVDEAKQDIAIAQALEVIGAAETVLLRSAEGSDDRALQFQQIASAIGSNKVLLRSV